MKTNRTAEYSKDRLVRVISVPNGRWCVQRFVQSAHQSDKPFWLGSVAVEYAVAKTEAGEELREVW